MYLLPCPHCQQPIEVAPSHAGDQTVCHNCQGDVAIPKLGQLRQLPSSTENLDQPVVGPTGSDSFGRQVAATILGLIALAGLLIGGFAVIRWVLIEAPNSTQSHIATNAEAFETLEAARLIREYEHMEKAGIDMPAMYNYKITELEKNRWGMIALVAGGVGVVAAVIAMLLASTGRTAKS